MIWDERRVDGGSGDGKDRRGRRVGWKNARPGSGENGLRRAKRADGGGDDGGNRDGDSKRQRTISNGALGMC